MTDVGKYKYQKKKKNLLYLLFLMTEIQRAFDQIHMKVSFENTLLNLQLVAHFFLRVLFIRWNKFFVSWSTVKLIMDRSSYVNISQSHFIHFVCNLMGYSTNWKLLLTFFTSAPLYYFQLVVWNGVGYKINNQEQIVWLCVAYECVYNLGSKSTSLNPTKHNINCMTVVLAKPSYMRT